MTERKNWRRRMSGKAIAVALAGTAIAGCTSSGLSPREVRGQDYATYVYSMYDPLASDATSAGTVGAASPAPAGAANPNEYATPGFATPAPRQHQPVATPAKIAVAQLGEVAPPAAMLETLRQDRAAFTSVQPLPGVMDVGYRPAQRGTPTEYSARQIAAEQGQRMRRYAGDVGADYLFLFGGTVDEATTSTPLTLANATIIGAFVIPSEKLQAQARAAGSLIDVRSGQVVLTVSADSNKSHVSPTAAKESDRLDMLKSLRDDITKQLADQLTVRIKEQAHTPVNLSAE